MPKRSTATFTSEDGHGADEAPLYVYYCKYSGEHCLITDASLGSLPRRRTDNAMVLDTEDAVVRIQAQQQPPKYIKRAEGELEKQLRYHTGAGLPFAYRTEPEGRYLYILPDALTSYASGANAGGGGPNVPVPPCIQRLRGDAVQVALQLEERQKATCLLSISADAVSVAVTTSASAAGPELLEMFAKALGVRQQTLQVTKGWSDRSRMLVISGLMPKKVHAALQTALDGDKTRNALRAYAPPQPPAALMPPPPARAAA